jgi:hypothetical protein
MEQPRLELRPGSGVLYKFFEDFRLLRADVPSEQPIRERDLVVAHHPDPEIGALRYSVQRVWQHRVTGHWCIKARLLGEKPKRGPRNEPRTHDYTKPTLEWGHNIALADVRSDGTIHLVGWGFGLREQDRIRLSTPALKTYVIHWIEYSDDPADFWRAVIKEKNDG